MNRPKQAFLGHTLVVWFGILGCSNAVVQTPPSKPPSQPAPPPQAERKPPTFRGVAAYDDGKPAGEALIAITSLESGQQVAVIAADREGRFETTLEAGEYALAVATDQGFSYVETMRVPDLDVKIALSRTCRPASGRAKGSVPGTRISLARKSRFTGDEFVGPVSADGSFTLCLPDGYYSAELTGAAVSAVAILDHSGKSAASTSFEIQGFASDLIKQPPRDVARVSAELDGLLADIVRSDARVIGLGEATHGTAELVTSRTTLTFELIRRADVRLVLFELDAILATAIDDYVMGGDGDLGKAVAELGFWISDTHELLRFFEDLRTYNATARNKVHVWGIDAQNTKPPVTLLLANERALKLTADQKAVLSEIGEKRGSPVRKLTPARRADLDALLAKLAKPRGTSQKDLRIALAARSLIVQVGYYEGDTAGLYGTRRDAGMASLASYLVAQTRSPRTCVWAHAGHISRDSDAGEPTLGKHLGAVSTHRYYPIGFYIYEGTVRAWDAAGAVGVTSHPIPRASDYMVEGAVMAATGEPAIAWLPIRDLPPSLRKWVETPRYVREVGAIYIDEEDTLSLRNVPVEFDALVVIKSGHDSSPTPTGVRKAGD
jgi:erythromycin esterase